MGLVTNNHDLVFPLQRNYLADAIFSEKRLLKQFESIGIYVKRGRPQKLDIALFLHSYEVDTLVVSICFSFKLALCPNLEQHYRNDIRFFKG